MHDHVPAVELMTSESPEPAEVGAGVEDMALAVGDILEVKQINLMMEILQDEGWMM